MHIAKSFIYTDIYIYRQLATPDICGYMQAVSVQTLNGEQLKCSKRYRCGLRYSGESDSDADADADAFTSAAQKRKSSTVGGVGGTPSHSKPPHPSLVGVFQHCKLIHISQTNADI